MHKSVAGISAEWMTYLGAVLSVPVLAMFVSGFSPFNDGRAYTIISDSAIENVKESGPMGEVLAVVLQETSKPAGLILFLSGIIALGYLGLHTVKLDRIPRQRMYVVFILTFFSMLFWAFFEQAGSSVNNFTDRNVNRVIGNTSRGYHRRRRFHDPNSAHAGTTWLLQRRSRLHDRPTRGAPR